MHEGFASDGPGGARHGSSFLSGGGPLGSGSTPGRGPTVIAAFLGDITCPSEAHLLRPFRHPLVDLGPPAVGLEFSNVEKNSTLVPCCFAAEVRAMFPDAAVVDDDTPGVTPKAKLKHGASHLAAGSSGLLISLEWPSLLEHRCAPYQPRPSSNLPSAPSTSCLSPPLRAALARLPRPTSRPRPRAARSSPCAMGNSHRGRDVSSCPAPQLRGDR
jgi:hypothetical protein